jgi:hypothetical protein
LLLEPVNLGLMFPDELGHLVFSLPLSNQGGDHPDGAADVEQANELIHAVTLQEESQAGK